LAGNFVVHERDEQVRLTGYMTLEKESVVYFLFSAMELLKSAPASVFI